MFNRQYTKAIIEYEKLNPNQKIFFKSSYELAQIYNDNQIFSREYDFNDKATSNFNNFYKWLRRSFLSI